MSNEGIPVPGTVSVSRVPVAALHRAGFTLVEILVVVVIIGISFGLVGVMVSRGAGNVKMKRLTLDIAATLRYARNHAVTEKKDFSFIVLNEERKYHLYKNLPDTDERKGFQPVISRALPQDVQINAQHAEDVFVRIDFHPAGSSSGGVLDIMDNDGRNYRITVNRVTGKLRVIKGGASG